MLPQSSPRTGFQEIICAQTTLFASAIFAHVSSVLTAYVLHRSSVGMQSVPAVGKFAQKPCRPLALSRPATLMPRAAATDWHVSPLRTVYVAPVQPVGVGDAAPEVRPLDAALELRTRGQSGPETAGWDSRCYPGGGCGNGCYGKARLSAGRSQRCVRLRHI